MTGTRKSAANTKVAPTVADPNQKKAPCGSKRKTPHADEEESKEPPPPPQPQVDDADITIEVDEDEDNIENDAEMAEEEAAAISAATSNSNRTVRGPRSKNAISCTHPRGVKPLGNAMLENKPLIRGRGFGLLAAAYTDALLLDLIRTHLGADDLVSLNLVSKAFYILANEEEIWREMVLTRWEGNFEFRIDWKNSYAFMARKEKFIKSNPTATIPTFPSLPTPLKFEGFYSDEIFQSFYCSHIDLESSFGECVDNIPRIHYKNLTPERFKAEFGHPNRPVIITGLMDSWPCYGPDKKFDETRWTKENWEKKYGENMFKIGKFTMRLNTYFEYMTQIQSDESPLYLFDSRFGEKLPELLAQYEVPEYFRDDYFNLLNGNSRRPHFRWILVGPARSGSTFHKDPNHTSAWNGLISGQKKWIMYHPNSTPPGIFPSENGAEVTTPISVAEWFINNYKEHRRRVEEGEERKRYELKKLEREAKVAAANGEPKNKKQKVSATASIPVDSTSHPTSTPSYLDGPVEATCQPGEIIFIPNGWWHTALNLTPSFAVTQNYVNEDNIWNVCDFLASDEGERERNLTLLAALEEKLQVAHPDVASMVESKKIEKEIARMEKEEEEKAKKTKKKSSLWERLTT